MHGLGVHTQHDFVRHARRFAAFLGRSPDTATSDDIRRYPLHQHENGVSPSTITGAVSALLFLFEVTLKRQALAAAAGGTGTLPLGLGKDGNGQRMARFGFKRGCHPRKNQYTAPLRAGKGS